MLKSLLSSTGTGEQDVSGSAHVVTVSTVLGGDALYKFTTLLDSMDGILDVNDKSYAGYEKEVTVSKQKDVIMIPGCNDYISANFLFGGLSAWLYARCVWPL